MNMRNNSGATLIELLAVISLMSVVILVITSAQLVWFNNTTDLPKQTLNQERIRFAFEQIVKDIESAESIICSPADGLPQTLSVVITKPSEVVTYNYDTNNDKLSITKQGNNILLAENVVSFIVIQESGIYYIEGKIGDIDLKTDLPYTLTTNAKPIVW